MAVYSVHEGEGDRDGGGDRGPVRSDGDGGPWSVHVAHAARRRRPHADGISAVRPSGPRSVWSDSPCRTSSSRAISAHSDVDAGKHLDGRAVTATLYPQSPSEGVHDVRALSAALGSALEPVVEPPRSRGGFFHARHRLRAALAQLAEASGRGPDCSGFESPGPHALVAQYRQRHRIQDPASPGSSPGGGTPFSTHVTTAVRRSAKPPTPGSTPGWVSTIAIQALRLLIDTTLPVSADRDSNGMK